MGRCNNQTCEQQVTGIDNIVPIVLANIIGLGPDDIPDYVQRFADVITGFRGHAIDQVIERAIPPEDIRDAIVRPLNAYSTTPGNRIDT